MFAGRDATSYSQHSLPTPTSHTNSAHIKAEIVATVCVSGWENGQRLDSWDTYIDILISTRVEKCGISAPEHNTYPMTTSSGSSSCCRGLETTGSWQEHRTSPTKRMKSLRRLSAPPLLRRSALPLSLTNTHSSSFHFRTWSPVSLQKRGVCVCMHLYEREGEGKGRISAEAVLVLLVSHLLLLELPRKLLPDINTAFGKQNSNAVALKGNDPFVLEADAVKVTFCYY